MRVNGAFVTVRSVLPLILPSVAEIVVCPAARRFARPPATIVAAPLFEDAQMTVAVMSFVLLSAYVPVAWNCNVVPVKAEGLTGVTTMETRAAPATVS